MSSRTYIAIDLKSFYTSEKCADWQLNPLTANLVVAETLGLMQRGADEGIPQ